VLYRVDRGNPSTCAWFQDLRFFTPGRHTRPFRYGMCREGTGPWERYELAADGARVPIGNGLGRIFQASDASKR
jgi:hypothetical protein